MPVFENLFASAQESLDSLFAGPLIYRASGSVLSITGTLASHRQQQDADREIVENWFAEVVEIAASELEIDNRRFLPLAGHEIAKTFTAGRLDVYLVTNGPDGKPYVWLDAEHERLAVYCKFIRTEAS